MKNIVYKISMDLVDQGKGQDNFHSQAIQKHQKNLNAVFFKGIRKN